MASPDGLSVLAGVLISPNTSSPLDGVVVVAVFGRVLAVFAVAMRRGVVDVDGPGVEGPGVFVCFVRDLGSVP